MYLALTFFCGQVLLVYLEPRYFSSGSFSCLLYTISRITLIPNIYLMQLKHTNYVVLVYRKKVLALAIAKRVFNE